MATARLKFTANKVVNNGCCQFWLAGNREVDKCEIGIDSSIHNSGIVPWQQERARRRNDSISLRLSSVCSTLGVSGLGLNSETYVLFTFCGDVALSVRFCLGRWNLTD